MTCCSHLAKRWQSDGLEEHLEMKSVAAGSLLESHRFFFLILGAILFGLFEF